MSKKVPCRVKDHVHRFYLPEERGQFVEAGSLVELDPREAMIQEKEGSVVIMDRAEVEFLDLKIAQPSAELAIKNREIAYLKRKLKEQDSASSAEAENALLKEQMAEMERKLADLAKSQEEKKPVAKNVAAKPKNNSSKK